MATSERSLYERRTSAAILSFIPIEVRNRAMQALRSILVAILRQLKSRPGMGNERKSSQADQRLRRCAPSV